MSFENFLKNGRRLQLVRLWTLLLLLSGRIGLVGAQTLGSAVDESPFYAETKQINQFIRRFNNEENRRGRRYAQSDPAYRGRAQRLNYLQFLFDIQSSDINQVDKEAFIAQVTDQADPIYLDFADDHWYAEVSAYFSYEGREEQIQLYFKIQQDHQGYKWALADAFVPRYADELGWDTSRVTPFLHPQSHELGFMNVRKTFQTHKDSVLYYLPNDYYVDHLSIFLMEFKRGKWKFETVSDTKFHFFQLDGWYFSVEQFNRPGNNSGWLIANLVALPAEQRDQFKNFVFHRGM